MLKLYFSLKVVFSRNLSFSCNYCMPLHTQTSRCGLSSYGLAVAVWEVQTHGCHGKGRVLSHGTHSNRDFIGPSRLGYLFWKREFFSGARTHAKHLENLFSLIVIGQILKLHLAFVVHCVIHDFGHRDSGDRLGRASSKNNLQEQCHPISKRMKVKWK